MEIAKFTPPKIVKDNEVKEDEKPPEQEKLEDTKIGTVNQEGIKDEGITAPPVSDAGKGVVEAPKKDDEDYEKTGDLLAWSLGGVLLAGLALLVGGRAFLVAAGRRAS